MDIIYNILIALAGLLFIVLGVMRIRKLISFKTEVRAVFVKNIVFRYKGTSRYSPVFKYKFKSDEIQKESFQRFDKEDIPEFVSGQTYTIFIDEKNPESFVIDKKVSFWDILLVLIILLIGLTCFVLPFFTDISALL